MNKKKRKAYIIKGAFMSNNTRQEWIEKITTSRKKAVTIKKNLNLKLLEMIEKGGEIAYNNLKSNTEKVQFHNREYTIGLMNEEEYSFFYLYKTKNPMPYKIYEEALD
jgi:hypothetical protein